MRETFQRVDTNHNGSIDAQEFSSFLTVKLHMRFDDATLGEIMHRFADRSTGEITYQSFCELVMGDSTMEGSSNVEKAATTARLEQDARDDAERDAVMLLRSRVRRSAHRLREIFDDVNRSGAGVLSYDDLRFALHLLGVVMTSAQFESLCRSIDANTDGVISYQEFVNYFNQNTVDKQMSYVRHAKGFSLEAALRLIRETIINRCGATDRALARCFAVFDEDGSGEVDEREFVAALKSQLGLQFDVNLSREIMMTLDSDGNGSIGMKRVLKVRYGYEL